MESQDRLRSILPYTSKKFLWTWNCRRYVISSITWELMKAHTRISKLQNKFNSLKEKMDKKMHEVTKRMKTAERDLKKGKPKEAAQVLKKAESNNEKLVKVDREQRDPFIKKAKAVKSKFPKDWKRS